jgi:hypothetical protein
MVLGTQIINQTNELVASTDAMLGNMHASVFDLERIAFKLRFHGNHQLADSIELKIISLLERKITRRLLDKSQKDRLMRIDTLTQVLVD